MRKKTKILSLLIIIFSVGSCGILFENVKFTKPEMKWFNVYKKQDTLIFQSLDSKIRDTTIITSKRIYHEYDPLRHDNRVNCVNIDYWNKKYKSQRMFGYCIGSNNENYHIQLSYLNSHFKANNKSISTTQSLYLVKMNFENVYELLYNRPKFHAGDDDDPKTLYWDEIHGIIKYKTFKGEIWERINF